MGNQQSSALTGFVHCKSSSEWTQMSQLHFSTLKGYWQFTLLSPSGQDSTEKGSICATTAAQTEIECIVICFGVGSFAGSEYVKEPNHYLT